MSDTKLSDLTATTTPSRTDILYILDGGNSRQVTVGNVLGQMALSDLGITASATEINVLDGIPATLTSTELGYVDGVTSAIQTQLNTKAPTASPTFTGTFTLPTGLTGVIRADSGVVSVDSDVTDIVSAASDSAAGKVELATIAETDTGTDATRSVTPYGLQGSLRNLRFLLFQLIDAETDVATDTDIGGNFPVPFAGTIIQDDSNPDYFAAYTDTAGTTGTMIVDVHLNGTTIMDTNKLDIETGEEDTTTATTQPDLTTTAVSAGDLLSFDIDAIHTTAAKGLKVMIAIRPD